MHILVGIYVYILWTGIFMLFLIFFIPVLPIMFLAFPMMFLNNKHWSCKPYLWYFNNVWLKVIKFLGV